MARDEQGCGRHHDLAARPATRVIAHAHQVPDEGEAREGEHDDHQQADPRIAEKSRHGEQAYRARDDLG